MPVDAQIVNDIFRKLLGRNADQEGLRCFTAFESELSVAWAIAGSPEAAKQGLRLPKSLIAWKICMLPAARMIFVPIAKNAHTSLVSALANWSEINLKSLPINDALVLKYGTADDVLHFALSENRTGLLLKDYHPLDMRGIFGDNNFIRAAVVRDPVERFLSAYSHFFLQGVVNALHQRHTDEVLRFHSLSPGATISVDMMLAYLESVPGYTVDPHFCLQSEYVKHIRLDLCVPIERLEILETIIGNRSGKPIQFERLNRRRSGSEPIPLDAKQISRLEDYYAADRILFEHAVANCDKQSAALLL